MPKRVLVLPLLFVLLLAGCQETGPFVPTDPGLLRGEGHLYLVGLGYVPRPLLKSLSAYYKDKYGLTIKILPPLALKSWAIDPARDQLIAERAIELLREGFRQYTADPQDILIALTQKDMYIQGYSWRFAFSYREGERFAVVSAARMTLGLTSAESATFQARIRKMLTKNIGILYYHLPVSRHPRSVLYGWVGGIEQLDYMGEDF